MYILVDDLGWADVGWNNVGLESTPFMDKLVKNGTQVSQVEQPLSHPLSLRKCTLRIDVLLHVPWLSLAAMPSEAAWDPFRSPGKSPSE